MGPATPHWLRCLGETGFKKIHTITRPWWIQWRRLKGNRKGRTGSYKHHKREWKNSGDFWLVKSLGISQKPAKTSLTLLEVQTPWRRERKTEKINVHPHKRIHLLEFRLTLMTRVAIAPSSGRDPGSAEKKMGNAEKHRECEQSLVIRLLKTWWPKQGQAQSQPLKGRIRLALPEMLP